MRESWLCHVHCRLNSFFFRDAFTKCKTIVFYQAFQNDKILHHEGVWEYLLWISLWWWLSICHLEGIFYFWIPQKVFGDLFQRSHFFFSSSANLKTWLPIHWCPFPLHLHSSVPSEQWCKPPRKVLYKRTFGVPDQGQTLDVWKSQTTESALRWLMWYITPRHSLELTLEVILLLVLGIKTMTLVFNPGSRSKSLSLPRT